MIFDSHAHYDSEQFDADRDELLGSVLPQKGVCGVIQMSADFESLEQARACVAESFDVKRIDPCCSQIRSTD